MRYWKPDLIVTAPGQWIQYDRRRRIATIQRVQRVQRGHPPRTLLRVESWAQNPADRCLIGYFPADDLRLAAEVVWDEHQAAIAGDRNRST